MNTTRCLASVPTSRLCFPGLVASSFVVLGVGFLAIKLARAPLSMYHLLEFCGAVLIGLMIFLPSCWNWYARRHGLCADTAGLSWTMTVLLRRRVVKIPWRNIRASRVIRDCEGDYVLYLLLKTGVPNPLPCKMHKGFLIITKPRLVCLYDEAWCWNAHLAQAAIEAARKVGSSGNRVQ